MHEGEHYQLGCMGIEPNSEVSDVLLKLDTIQDQILVGLGAHPVESGRVYKLVQNTVFKPALYLAKGILKYVSSIHTEIQGTSITMPGVATKCKSLTGTLIMEVALAIMNEKFAPSRNQNTFVKEMQRLRVWTQYDADFLSKGHYGVCAARVHKAREAIANAYGYRSDVYEKLLEGSAFLDALQISEGIATADVHTPFYKQILMMTELGVLRSKYLSGLATQALSSHTVSSFRTVTA